MKKKPVALLEFSHRVDVTDPCFRRDSRALKTVENMMPGPYAGYIHVHQQGPWGPYVQGLWVVRQGTTAPLSLPPEQDWVLLGRICVDSGLAGFFDRKPDLTGQWDDIIQWMEQEDKLVGNRLHAYAKKLDGRDGFWAPAGAGDGMYRFYGLPSGELFTALCLWFDDEE